MSAWIQTNFDDACKRNAGRRKLHMRKREARANRIVAMLATPHSAGAPQLCKAKYGSLTVASVAKDLSKTTLSRDFA